MGSDGLSSGRLLKLSKTRHIMNTKRRSNKRMSSCIKEEEEESTYFQSLDSDRPQDSHRAFQLRDSSPTTELRRGSLRKTTSEPGLKYEFDLDIGTGV